MARAAMVFKSTTKNYSGSILLPKTENELLKPDSLKHHLMENRTLKLMVWAVSEKNLLRKEIKKRLPHVSQIPVEKAQLIIMRS